MGDVIYAPSLPSTSHHWARAGQALAETRILSHLLLSYLAPGSPVKGVSRSSFLQLATNI